MLTARGYWFLVVVSFVLALGVLALPVYTVTPALIGLTLLAWFVAEWVVFQVRANAAASRLKVTRRVIQGGRDVPMVWAGLAFDVRIRVSHDGPVRLPFAIVDDRLPQAAELIDGDPSDTFSLADGEPGRIVYALKGPSPGVLRFEGTRVRIADLHGFFYHRVFLPDETEYLILPPLTDDEGKQRADKRFNTLPPPGVHRLRRPGSGSELLDLRDYRPGDPPKMIAWKPSARRDRLITKEYESDVPVRCVLYLDTSDGMRLGPPGATNLTRMASITAGVSQAAAGNRDLVGLTTFDETEAKGATPARTKIHMIGILRRLAEVSALQPSTKGVPADELTRRAYPLAQELYPALMSKRVNTMPLSRLWLPLLDKWWGWIVFFVIVLSPLMVLSKDWMAMMIEAAVSATPRSWFWLIRAVVALVLLHALVMLPATLGLMFWGVYGVRGWFGLRKVQLTERKRLAAVFALQDRTGPAGIERLIHDDEAYAERVGRFLQERQIRMPVPLYDDQGRYKFRCPAKAGVLATAMMRAVGRARDNELYVILADLVELGPDLGPLLKAARVARARHHQVLVLVPWPDDVPPPDDAATPVQPAGRNLKKRKRPKGLTPREAERLPVVRDALTRHYHESFRKFRRLLGQAGATVVRVNDGDPVQVVLDRLDRLRGMRSRR